MLDGSTRLLVRLLRKQYGRMFGGVVVAFVGGSIATIDPLLMRHLIDKSLTQRKGFEALIIVLSIGLCYVGRSAMNGISGILSFGSYQKLGMTLRAELLKKMTSLSLDWHEQTFLGEKLSIIEKDVEQIALSASDLATSIFRVLFLCLVNLAIMSYMNWRMTLAILPFLFLFVWIRADFRTKIQRQADQSQKAVANATAAMTELLAGVSQIQILTAEEPKIAGVAGVWDRAIFAQWTQRKTEITFGVSVSCVLAAAILAVLGLGVHEFLVGILTLGGLVAFYAYVSRVFEPLNTAMELYARSQRMMASARRVNEVLTEEPGVPDQGTITTVYEGIKLLECNDVSFKYKSGNAALRGISLKLLAGERIAIVGPSGSGKSTLSKLLARMVDPTHGRISLDGVANYEYKLKTLRQMISYLPQQPILFSGTVRDNLLLGNPDASDREIWSAIRTVQLEHVVAQLPEGINSMLGPDALGFSGGEKQRLALARALLRKSSILILDEATSALDLPTETALFHSIAQAQDGRGLIIISHRLGSISWVDRIAVLERGCLIAEGKHEDLAIGCQSYQRLLVRESEAHTVQQEQ